MLKTIRNIFISVFVLLILFGGAGIAYLLFYGDDPVPVKKVEATTDTNPTPPKPKKPSPNAVVGVSIQALLSPVKPGENSSVSIKTLPEASCVITVTYNNVPSKDSGLVPKIADEYGTTSWSWTVDKTAPVGKWPVKVVCSHNKNSGMVLGDLIVQK
jgi:hypothetical protein